MKEVFLINIEMVFNDSLDIADTLTYLLKTGIIFDRQALNKGMNWEITSDLE